MMTQVVPAHVNLITEHGLTFLDKIGQMSACVFCMQ